MDNMDRMGWMNDFLFLCWHHHDHLTLVNAQYVPSYSTIYLTNIISLHPHISPWKWLYSYLYLGLKILKLKELRHLPKVTQLVNEQESGLNQQNLAPGSTALVTALSCSHLLLWLLPFYQHYQHHPHGHYKRVTWWTVINTTFKLIKSNSKKPYSANAI